MLCNLMRCYVRTLPDMFAQICTEISLGQNLYSSGYCVRVSAECFSNPGLPLDATRPIKQLVWPANIEEDMADSR